MAVAFATLVTNADYGLGALALARSLRQTGSEAPLYVLAGPGADGLDALEALRIVPVLASPALPGTCAEIWRRLGLDGTPQDQRLPEAAAWGGYPGGLPVSKGPPLFPRLPAE